MELKKCRRARASQEKEAWDERSCRLDRRKYSLKSDAVGREETDDDIR
jgi:hypothetical protein